jgi:hypothetical protein
MATSIVSPSVDNTFGSIYNMFGGQGSGTSGNIFGQPFGGNFGSGGFGIPTTNTSPQPDQVMTSVWNTLGNVAPALLQQGGNLVGTGVGMTGQGFGGTQAGMQTINPALAYYQSLLGNPAQGAAYQSSLLSPTYQNLITNAMQNDPRGGYGSTVAATAPQAQAAQAGNFILQQQPAAAQGLLAGGGEQSDIGATQAGIGAGVSGLGTTLTGQGLQALNALQTGVLNKQQLNYSQPSALQQVMQAFQTFIG